jgi:hypothetical protein
MSRKKKYGEERRDCILRVPMDKNLVLLERKIKSKFKTVR